MLFVRREGIAPSGNCISLRPPRFTTRNGTSSVTVSGLGGPEPTFADAILDRIVQNAYRIELDGASMRKTIARKDDENPKI